MLIHLQSAKPFETKDEFEVCRSVRVLYVVCRLMCVQKELVKHVETTLARSLYNCDELYVLSVILLEFLSAHMADGYGRLGLHIREQLSQLGTV